MAPNKFATKLHRNSNKMTVILVYAVLEWILILLILLNSLFSYLIRKYSKYFGLKPPCQWCSRIDHLLEPKNIINTYEDLICDAHATEISRLCAKICNGDKNDSHSIPKLEKHFRNDLNAEALEKDGENSDMGKSDFQDHCKNSDCSTVTSQRSDISVDNEFEPAAIKQPGHSPAAEEDESSRNLFGDEITPQMPISREVCIQSQSKEPTPPLAPYLQVNNSLMENQEVRITTDLVADIVPRAQGPNQLEKTVIQETVILDRNSYSGINHNLTAHLEPEIVEAEKRELEAEESRNGSPISEVEGDDGAVTIARLKSALEAEQKALKSLQSEFEEERNAAAIAANETMAMITRIQEEKSAMQMEALHYQRMMEEQSDYDQEALQLLNDLMIKREKEKQDLEKDLEIYRKKVLDYEAKEKMVMKNKCTCLRSRNSTASSSNLEDNDELFIDLINEEKCDDSRSGNNNFGEGVLDLEENGFNCMKNLSILDESIAEFEEERMSILEELKALEKKLFILADNDEQPFDGQEFDESYKCGSPDENGALNGESFINKIGMGSTAKRLLPLFDQTDLESEEGEVNEEDAKSQSNGMRTSLMDKIELENDKVTIEEEVDHVYGRLQALEADKEFLKHCFSSLKKGDQGTNLLEEILEHLRDLRTGTPGEKLWGYSCGMLHYLKH